MTERPTPERLAEIRVRIFTVVDWESKGVDEDAKMIRETLAEIDALRQECDAAKQHARLQFVAYERLAAAEDERDRLAAQVAKLRQRVYDAGLTYDCQIGLSDNVACDCGYDDFLAETAPDETTRRDA